MREVAEEGEDEGNTSDLSPYHSDSDSAVMMSGNSPYISKAARYNFLLRSVRLRSKHNVRASILASSLSEVNLDSTLQFSGRVSTSTGPPSFVLHSSRYIYCPIICRVVSFLCKLWNLLFKTRPGVFSWPRKKVVNFSLIAPLKTRGGCIFLKVT